MPPRKDGEPTAKAAPPRAHGLRGESQLHINILEMRAVRRILKMILPPTGFRILVATVNSTVVTYINRE